MKDILLNPMPSFSTPFQEDGEIDFGAVKKNIGFLRRMKQLKDFFTEKRII